MTYAILGLGDIRKETITIIPTIHPIAKTAIEIRRSIARLTIYNDQNPNDIYVQDGSVLALIAQLSSIRSQIPKALRDVDLKT